jgi:hypothetical protein
MAPAFWAGAGACAGTCLGVVYGQAPICRGGQQVPAILLLQIQPGDAGQAWRGQGWPGKGSAAVSVVVCVGDGGGGAAAAARGGGGRGAQGGCRVGPRAPAGMQGLGVRGAPLEGRWWPRMRGGSRRSGEGRWWREAGAGRRGGWARDAWASGACTAGPAGGRAVRVASPGGGGRTQGGCRRAAAAALLCAPSPGGGGRHAGTRLELAGAAQLHAAYPAGAMGGRGPGGSGRWASPRGTECRRAAPGALGRPWGEGPFNECRPRVGVLAPTTPQAGQHAAAGRGHCQALSGLSSHSLSPCLARPQLRGAAPLPGLHGRQRCRRRSALPDHRSGSRGARPPPPPGCQALRTVKEALCSAWRPPDRVSMMTANESNDDLTPAGAPCAPRLLGRLFCTLPTLRGAALRAASWVRIL